MGKKVIMALLALLFALPCAAEEFYEEMPALLRFTQTTQMQGSVTITYPDTASDAVDAAVRGAIDHLAEEGMESLRAGAELDVGAVISRSGSSMLSFLVLAQTTKDRELLDTAFEAMVFDAATGERVQLSQLLKDEALDLLSGEMSAALSAAFPALEPDAAALDALCDPEAIREMGFTLGAARLTLTVPADAVYPGKETLVHVNVPYSRLRAFMTDYGLAQTDNSRYKMVALTYDDGPNRGATRRVLEALRRYGAQATFFVVGERFHNNHDMLAREQNGNYSIQSHTYHHKYPDELQKGEEQREKARMNEELGDLIGVVPTMMRAPGGHAAYYCRREIGYPLIQWNLASGDSGNPHVDKIAQKVIGSAGDGKIILMHDLNGGSPTYTETVLGALTERGFLFVTVEELFEDAGVEMRENVAYKSPYVIEYENP